MGAFSDHAALDPLGRNRFESHGEHKSVRVDDFDLLAGTRPQRARQMACIAAFDDSAAALAPREKCRQNLST